MEVLTVELINITQTRLRQIVSQNGIIKVKYVTKMRVNYHSVIIHAKVFFPGELHGNLPELLLDGSTTRVEIVINVLDVDHYELAHAFPAQA